MDGRVGVVEWMVEWGWFRGWRVGVVERMVVWGG